MSTLREDRAAVLIMAVGVVYGETVSDFTVYREKYREFRAFTPFPSPALTVILQKNNWLQMNLRYF